MSEHNITVEGGSSVRLPTAGKYCDRDIVITAEGGSGGGQIYVDAVVEVKVGETISLSTIGEGEADAGTPQMTLLSLGENPDIISVETQEWAEWLDITGVSEGKTIITYEYYTEKWEDNYLRTVNIQINVVPGGGGSTESDAEYQYEDTINAAPGDYVDVALPCPYDSPGGSSYTIISGGHLIDGVEDMIDIVGIQIRTEGGTGTAVIRFDYYSDYPAEDTGASCTLILTINVE